ncbi:flavin reductase family protein [Ideonella paludis]
MPIDPAALRSAFGRFATGVTIVTCLDPKGQRVGLTVNSFSSLSLDPALVLWSLRVSSQALPAFVEAGHFAVNVLAETQMPLSRRFASPMPDRFAEGEWSAGEGAHRCWPMPQPCSSARRSNASPSVTMNSLWAACCACKSMMYRRWSSRPVTTGILGGYSDPLPILG